MRPRRSFLPASHLAFPVLVGLVLFTLACAFPAAGKLTCEWTNGTYIINQEYPRGYCERVDQESGMVESAAEESASEEDIGAVEAPEDTAAVYLGETDIPPLQQEVSDFTVVENRTILYVDEEGRVTGEQLLIYTYTQSGVDEQPVYCTSEWRTIFEGTLGDVRGQVYGTLTYHFVSTGPGANDPQDRTSTADVAYDLTLSGDVLIGTLRDEPESFPFQLYRQ